MAAAVGAGDSVSSAAPFAACFPLRGTYLLAVGPKVGVVLSPMLGWRAALMRSRSRQKQERPAVASP